VPCLKVKFYTITDFLAGPEEMFRRTRRYVKKDLRSDCPRSIKESTGFACFALLEKIVFRHDTHWNYCISQNLMSSKFSA